MKLLIGTKNPAKINGATQAFSEYYLNVEITGIAVQSNVSEEPVDLDIYKGAMNRVNNLIEYANKNNIEADYYLGIESGITNLLGKWVIINIAVIKDKSGYESWGASPAFPVPERYVNEIINTDLSKVMDKIFNEKELRLNKGGISFLTHSVINRIDMTKQAFIMALTQFINDDIWKD